MDTQLTKPAIIWALDFEEGRPVPCAEDQPIAWTPARGTFRWLHLNLADQWTREWIAAAETVPRALRAMLTDSERHQRAMVEDGWIGCVLHDMERDFDRHDAERTGVLRLVLGPSLMLTARLHPLRSADIVRTHLLTGEARVAGPADALDLVVSAIVENIAAVSRGQATQIESFEDALLYRPEAFDHRRLIDLRRRVVQFHRLLSGMRAAFRRLEHDGDLPPDLLATVEELAQQLGGIDDDMLSINGQLRLLREEADLQATQRTNQNLYVLSILSALLLPATLVTGFFGMNTGGLPFADGSDGTLLAGGLAGLASLGVYLLLRRLGLHRN
jgi:Mg2+ and Co2+ transporter CorA